MEERASVTATNSDTIRAAVPDKVTATVDPSKPDAISTSVPDKVAETVAPSKSDATIAAGPEKVVAAADPPNSGTAIAIVPEDITAEAKAAFERNKCGACHSVGEFAAATGTAKRNDLSGIGLNRSAAWISGFLQKSEKADGKLHIKTFTGTGAELAALSQWLASQKSKP